MARQKGMLNLSGNLEPLAGAPLDSRSITPTVADLYIASNWPYKYIGMKTTVTATGDTYRLVNLDVTQESSWVKEGGESGQTIQYDELPAASSTLAGKIYQYTGVTNLQYTNGYFYECVNDGGTYKWQQTNTQPGTSYNDFTGATSQDAGAHGLVPAPTTEDIAKFLKGDGTWATVPMPSFDYSNTSPEAMNFSTDEKVIGTWIDSKPLYQKTIISTIPTCSQQYVPESSYESIGVSVDKCIEINGFFVSNGVCTPISYAMAQQDTKVSCITVRALTNAASEHKNTIQLSNANTSWSGGSAIITLRYTKTTDTAVASGEKIVGQWIDGKKVYEKTIVDTMPSEVGVDKFIDINTTIETVVSSYAVIHGGSYHPLQLFVYEDTDTSRYFIRTNSASTNPNKIGIRTGHARFADSTVHITLRYTKTTD